MAKSGPPTRLEPSRSGATKDALVAATIETLKADGFTGTSARAIASRAGCNQALIFYHFGSVVGLLLAALDHVSESRFERYDAIVATVRSPADLVAAAAVIFREDLDEGYVAVLVEMIAGTSSTPGLGAEVAARLKPWHDFARRAIDAAFAPSALGSLIPSGDAAHGIVALYLGLEMLSHLDGDRTAAVNLFGHATRLATLFEALAPAPGVPTSTPDPTGA